MNSLNIRSSALTLFEGESNTICLNNLINSGSL